MKEERLIGACDLEVSDMELWCSCFMARGEDRTSWKHLMEQIGHLLVASKKVGTRNKNLRS